MSIGAIHWRGECRQQRNDQLTVSADIQFLIETRDVRMDSVSGDAKLSRDSALIVIEIKEAFDDLSFARRESERNRQMCPRCALTQRGRPSVVIEISNDRTSIRFALTDLRRVGALGLGHVRAHLSFV